MQNLGLGRRWRVRSLIASGLVALVTGCGGHTQQHTADGSGGAATVTGGAASATGGSAVSLATGGSNAQTAIGGASVQGGNSATGGRAATGGSTACVNAACVAAHSDPYTCVDGACRPLLTANCPLLLPTDQAGKYSAKELLKQPAPIIIGGFASMANASNRADTLAAVNWNLALTEFNSVTSGGLQSYDGSGTQRPLVALICQGYNATPTAVDESMQHLALDIHVPAVLSTLTASNLYEAYQFTANSTYLAAHGQPVFFMSSGSATMQLASLQDNGLVWHMLGNPRLIAQTAVALVKRIEPVVRAARKTNFEQTGVDDPSLDSALRVTLIYSDDATMVDIHDVLTTADGHSESLLTINGAPATAPANKQYFHEAAVVSGSSMITAATTSVRTYPPHIVIALGTSEFPKYILPEIETSWSTTAPGQMRPFYVVAPRLFNNPELATALNTQSTGVEKRLVGFNYSGLKDSHTQSLYDAYYANLVASYPGGALLGNLAGTENMYDAAYYLLYAIAIAEVNRKPGNPITGTDILTAVQQRVILPGATSVDVGVTNLSSVLTKLQASDSAFSMALWGLDGPPNFDVITGTRTEATSAWCMKSDTSQPPAYAFAADGLIFDPVTQTFTAPPGGVPSCLQNY